MVKIRAGNLTRLTHFLFMGTFYEQFFGPMFGVSFSIFGIPNLEMVLKQGNRSVWRGRRSGKRTARSNEHLQGRTAA